MREGLGGDDIDGGLEPAVPIWAVFGDLMSVALGAFVLILVSVLGVQLELSAKLDEEVKQRKEETRRRQTLEQALAGPLAAGRVTLVDGRIGISGNVLFALNSDQLQPEGREVLKSLAQPLTDYLRTRDEILMVSGFTDNQQVREGNRRFADNWELSAERALTVTRALIEEGLPAGSVFAAAFGAEQPVASNADAEGRAKNRRVEIAPVPKHGAQAMQSSAALSGDTVRTGGSYAYAQPAGSAKPGSGVTPQDAKR
jgi:outer membrane protein OmpA-like peptidoglycan-associated protein